jgi:hypothetical protein
MLTLQFPVEKLATTFLALILFYIPDLTQNTHPGKKQERK